MTNDAKLVTTLCTLILLGMAAMTVFYVPPRKASQLLFVVEHYEKREPIVGMQCEFPTKSKGWSWPWNWERRPMKARP